MIWKNLVEEGMNHFGINPHSEALGRLTLFIEELEKWGQRINLTGLRDAHAIVTILLYDTFFVHTLMEEFVRVVDLGSGSGIGAIPLAILNSEKEVISVDKSLRKIQFQRHASRMLKLDNIMMIHSRIEEIEPLKADCIHARAFGSTPLSLEKALNHLAPGGTVILPRSATEIATEHPDYFLFQDIPYTLPFSGRSSRVFVYRKQDVLGAERKKH